MLRDDCGVQNLADLAALSLEELLVGAGIPLHEAKALRNHRFLKRAIKQHRLAARAAVAAAIDGDITAAPDSAIAGISAESASSKSRNRTEAQKQRDALRQARGEISFESVSRSREKMPPSSSLLTQEEQISGEMGDSVPTQALGQPEGVDGNGDNVGGNVQGSDEPDRRGSESLLSRRLSTAAASKRRLSVAQQARRSSLAALSAPSSSTKSKRRASTNAAAAAAAGSLANSSTSSSEEVPFLSQGGFTPSRIEELTVKFASLPDPVVTESDFLWFASLAKDVTLQFEVGLLGNEVRRFRKTVQAREEALAEAAAAAEAQRIAAEAAALAEAEASHAAYLVEVQEEAIAAAVAAAEAARVAAAEAAALPLPPPWCERPATEGGDEDAAAGIATVYYWNQYTDETTWERPSPLPEGWYEMPPTDADSPCHFWNEITNETTWDRPLLPGAVAAASAAAYAVEAVARSDSATGGITAAVPSAEDELIHVYDGGAVAMDVAPQAPESPTSNFQPFAAQFAQEQESSPLPMHPRSITLSRPALDPPPSTQVARRSTHAPQRRGTTFGPSAVATKPQRRGTLASFAAALFGGESSPPEPPVPPPPPPPLLSPLRTSPPRAAEVHETSMAQMSPLNEKSLRFQEDPDSPTLSDGSGDIEHGRSSSSSSSSSSSNSRNALASDVQGISESMTGTTSGNMGFNSGFAAQYAQDHTLSPAAVRRHTLSRPAPDPPSAQARRSTLAPQRRGTTFGPSAVATKPQRRGTLASFAAALFGGESSPPEPPAPPSPPPPPRPPPRQSPPRTPPPPHVAATEADDVSPGQMSPLNEVSLRLKDAPDSPSPFHGDDDVERGHSSSSSRSDNDEQPPALPVSKILNAASTEIISSGRKFAVQFAQDQMSSPEMAPQRRNTVDFPAAPALNPRPSSGQARRETYTAQRRGTMATIVEGASAHLFDADNANTDSPSQPPSTPPSVLPPPALSTLSPPASVPPSSSKSAPEPLQEAPSQPAPINEAVPSVSEEQHPPVPASSDKDSGNSVVNTSSGAPVDAKPAISKTRQRLLDRRRAQQAIEVRAREEAAATGSSLDTNPEYSLDEDEKRPHAAPMLTSPASSSSSSLLPAPPQPAGTENTNGLTKMQLRVLKRKAQNEAAAAKAASGGAHSKGAAATSRSSGTTAALFTVNEGENGEAEVEEKELAMPRHSLPNGPTTPPPSRKTRISAASSPQLSNAEEGLPPLLSTRLPFEEHESESDASSDSVKRNFPNTLASEKGRPTVTASLAAVSDGDVEAPSSSSIAETNSTAGESVSENIFGEGTRQGRGGRGVGGRSGRGSGRGGGRGRGRGAVDSKRLENTPAGIDLPHSIIGESTSLPQPPSSLPPMQELGETTKSNEAQDMPTSARATAAAVNASRRRPEGVRGASSSPPRPSSTVTPPHESARKRANGRESSPPRDKTQERRRVSPPRPTAPQAESLATRKEESHLSSLPPIKKVEQSPSPSAHEDFAPAPPLSNSPPASTSASSKSAGLSKADKKELKALQAKKKAGGSLNGEELQRYKALKDAWMAESGKSGGANSEATEAKAAESEVAPASVSSSTPEAGRDSSMSKPEKGRARGRGIAAAFGSATPLQLPPKPDKVEWAPPYDSPSATSSQRPPPSTSEPEPSEPSKHSPLSSAIKLSAPNETNLPSDNPSATSSTSAGLTKAEKKELKALQTRKKSGDALGDGDLGRYKELKARFQQAP